MININNVTKIYNKEKENSTTLFDNFSMEIETGEFISVVGSNGSGKTSLLNIICGSAEADGGEILLDGKNILPLKEYKRSEFIGRVFQDPSRGTCPSMTILENMALADSKGKGFGLKLCVNEDRFEMYRVLLKKLKLGLEDKMRIKVGSLSGGQRQALALLMSTTSALSLLILDEHTAALDPKTCDTMMELTDEIIKEYKMTAIMVTHNLKYALEYGNRLVMLKQGEIALDIKGKEKEEYNIEQLFKVFAEMA